MKRVLPPFVYAVEAKGKTYHYFRKDGANVRVDPSAPGFWATYADLKQARAPVPKTVTFGGLIASYEKSARFKRLADRTKADYGKVLAFIKDRFRGKNPANLRVRAQVAMLRKDDATDEERVAAQVDAQDASWVAAQVDAWAVAQVAAQVDSRDAQEHQFSTMIGISE